METDIDSIAKGYAVAALWTLGVDEAAGEYQPDEDKVAALMPLAHEAAGAFVHIVGRELIDASGVDAERIGHCLHYDREGHGTGFGDEGREVYAIDRMERVARMMGPDDRMTGEILNRYPEAG